MTHTTSTKDRPVILSVWVWVWVWACVGVKGQVFPEASEDNLHIFNTDGTYIFSYDTGSGRHQSFRSEHRDSQGRVSGRFGYLDPDGALRITRYQADRQGYRATMEVYQRVNLAPSDPLLVGPLPQQQPQAPTQSSTTDATSEMFMGPPILGPVPFVPPQGPVLLIGPLPRPLQPLTPVFVDLSEELGEDTVKPGSVPPPPLPQELLRVIPLQESPPLGVPHLGESTGKIDRPGQSTTSRPPQVDPILQDNQPSTTVLQDTFSSNNDDQAGVSEKRESVQLNTAMMENNLSSDAAQGDRQSSDARHERRNSSGITQGNVQRNDVSQGSRRRPSDLSQPNRQASDVTQMGTPPFDVPQSDTLLSNATQGNKQPDIQAQQNIQPYGQTKQRKQVKTGTQQEGSDSSDNTRQNKRQLNSNEQQISQLYRNIDESKGMNTSEVRQGTEKGENALNPPLLTSIKRPPGSRVEFRRFSSSRIKVPDGQTTTDFPSSSTAPTTATDSSLRKNLACWKKVWDDSTTSATTTATTSTMGNPQQSADLPLLLESLSPRRGNKKEERTGGPKESQELPFDVSFRRISVLPRTYLPVSRGA